MARHPAQLTVSAEDFQILQMPVAEPGERELLVKTIYIGVDAGCRAMMNDDPYVVNMAVGHPFVGTQIAQVVQSNAEGFAPGDFVHTMSTWSDFSVFKPAELGPWCYKIDGDLSLAVHLAGLGFTGFTAWVGLNEIARPTQDDTVVVSAAAGAVGFAAGQLARMTGTKRVVGIAGGANKCQYVVEEGGFDACVDYKDPAFADHLKTACPEGIDVYFENVGGKVQQTVLPLMNDFGRIALCGQVAQYGDEASHGPNWFPLTLKRLKVQGFLANDHFECFAQFRGETEKWFRSGDYKSPVSIVKGLENCHEAINSLISGKNLGRQVIQVAEALPINTQRRIT